MRETDKEIRRRTDWAEVDRLRHLSEYPKSRILIVTTPRTASTFFCSYLHKLGIDNLPSEFFSNVWAKEYMAANQLDIHSYISEIIKGKVFGAKLMLHQYQYWKMMGVDIPQHFNKIIYVYRSDEIALTTSRAIARKTDFWSSWSSTGWGADKARLENGIEEYHPLQSEIDYENTNLIHEMTSLSDFTFDLRVEFNEIIHKDKNMLENCKKLIDK